MFGKRILSLEVSESSLRAAVVSSSGGNWTIEECAEVERNNGGLEESGSLRVEEVKTLLEKLTSYPKLTVLVSPVAATINLSMEQVKLSNMKPPQICEALRWEAEPYSGIPATDSMIGYECISSVHASNQADSQMQADMQVSVEPRTDIRVTVFPQSKYKDMRELLGQAGLKLRRIYSDESCFPLAANFSDSTTDKIVVHVEPSQTKIVSIQNQSASSCYTIHVGSEAIRQHLDGNLNIDLDATFQESFGAVKDDTSKVYVSGLGGCDREIVAFIGLSIGMEAIPHEPFIENPEGADQRASFTVAIGAGLRELGFLDSQTQSGVSDAVPLSKQIQDRMYIAPVAGVVLLLVVFGLFYQQMKNDRLECDAETKSLENEAKSRQSAINNFNALKKKMAQLKAEEILWLAEEEFLNETADMRLQQVENFLDKLPKAAPNTISLNELVRESDGQYVILGEGLDARSINELAVLLQNEDWCAGALVSELSPLFQRGTGRNPVHKFRIDIRLAEGDK